MGGNRPSTMHVRAICQMGKGHACCRYLCVDEGGFICVKHMPEWANQIEARVAAGEMVAMGDNCPGLHEVMNPTKH